MRTNITLDAQGETLAAYHWDRSRCHFIMGPLGSGKTSETVQKSLVMMAEQEPNPEGIRPTRSIAVRNTYSDLMNTTVKDWLALFDGMGSFIQGGLKPPSQLIRFKLDDGTRVEHEIIFLALDRDDAVRKLRGVQATWFWLNEIKELSKAVVDMADGRHGRYPSIRDGGVMPTWHGMFGDTNAPDEDHWYYNAAENNAWAFGADGRLLPHLEQYGNVENIPEQFRWKFYTQPGGVINMGNGRYEPNPKAENIQNLPKAYYSAQMANKSTEWIKVNLANEYGFVVDGKAVYPEYRDSYHCRPCKYDPRLPLHIGMDFGLTPGVTFMQRSLMGQVRVLSELVATRLGAKNLAREIKLHIADHYQGCEFGSITGDPAGNAGSSIDEEKTVFTVLAAEGVIAKPAHSNDFTIRREAVAQLLTTSIDGEPALVIDSSCRKLRKGMAGGYCFKRVKVSGDRYHDKPDKGELSHICEGLQYGCMGLGIGREVLIRSQAHQTNRPAIANTDYSMF